MAPGPELRSPGCEVDGVDGAALPDGETLSPTISAEVAVERVSLPGSSPQQLADWSNYRVEVTADSDGDGITDAARVGVPGDLVPDTIPRLPGLTAKERQAEERFATTYEKNPAAMALRLRARMLDGEISDGPHIFATDEAKRMSEDFNPPDANKKALKHARGRFNIAVHQTANALTKKAFTQHLDEAIGADPENEHLVVCTMGGCGAGKGRSIKGVPEVQDKVDAAVAVWDSAGEQNGTELPWLAETCKQKNCKLAVLYVDRDAEDAWQDRVISRAEQNGRMVDARLFAESYALGAKNMQAFAAAHADDPQVEIMYLDGNSQIPKLKASMSPQSSSLDHEQLFHDCAEHLLNVDTKKRVVHAGYEVGARIWGGIDDHHLAGDDAGLPSEDD